MAAIPSLQMMVLFVFFFLLLVFPSSSSSSSPTYLSPSSSCSARNASKAINAASASTAGAASYVVLLLRTTAAKSAALKDCKGQLSDSVDLLNSAAKQIRRLRPENFYWNVDNALTWTSAALTNQDTCLQGLAEVKNGTSAKMRQAVVKRVSRASRLTSYALHLINRLAPRHV